MPELPEIETIKRDLEGKILGLRIVKADVLDARVIRNCSPKLFVSRLKDRTFHSVKRLGKAVILELDQSFLVVQPMMTGQLIYRPSKENPKSLSRRKEPPVKAAKVTFRLSNGGELTYNDHRLFGRLNLVTDLNEVKFFQTIGPDPFSEDFSVEWLKDGLSRRRTPIKSLLMNQNFLAGIGNIYASEILFGSRINPRRAANTLNSKEVQKLYQNTVDVLTEAVAFRGTSMNTYRDASGNKGNFIDRIKVYGRTEEPCLACQAPIVRIVQAGRSTFFCQGCQV